MTRYLLPCPCSQRIVGAPGQAGGTVRCPGCGADVPVPRLGALERLEKDAPAVGSRGAPVPWNAARALVMAGVVCTLGAAATAAALRGWRTAEDPVDETALRSAVTAAPVSEAHQSWLDFERLGIATRPVADEVRRWRRDRALGSLETVAWVTAAVGAAIAAIGAAVAASRRRPAADVVP